MRLYSVQDIEELTNWDGMLCKPPFKNRLEQRQYYARFIDRSLWRYFSQEDWRRVAEIIDELRVSPKLLKTTRFLLDRHMQR